MKFITQIYNCMKVNKNGNCFDLPQLGFGLGLRSSHYAHILDHSPDVDWFEIISENYMDNHGYSMYLLERIAERYPIVMHGVSMSIGSTDPIDMKYLHGLKRLSKRINPQWISDHLCWTGILTRNSHDLLPLSFTEESLEHVVGRIKIVQDVLERPLILENPSSYLTFKQDTFTEWEFIKEMANQADCGILLDVNNIYVSSVNHEFDPIEYLNAIPMERVVQMHIAGHTNCGTHIIDTHDHPVVDEVWKLYHLAQQKAKGASTLLEWDAKIPPFDELLNELNKAKEILLHGPKKQLNKKAKIQESEAVPHPLFIDKAGADNLSIVEYGSNA